MKQNGLYKTAIYCRLSQDDGIGGDSSSIQTQKMILEKFALEHGFAINDFYVDDGFTGLNFNRPGFQRMIKDIETGLINLVITKDLSRLGRDYIQTGYYIEIYFSEKSVRYIAVNDNIDTFEGTNDIAPFKNILNDMYSKDISKKVKTAKRQRMYKGYYVASQPPYGYKVNENNRTQLMVDEEAADVVRLIYSLALTNIGVVKIVKELNAQSIVAPGTYKAQKGDKKFVKLLNGRKEKLKNLDIETWNANTVGTILRDIVYLGDMENHKFEVKNYKTKKCTRVPKDQRIIVRNTHEAIVSREDFEKIQELIKNRQRPSYHNHPNIFKGILKCQNCGRTFTLCYSKRRNGDLIWRYRCMGNTLKHGIDTEINSINYDELYGIVENRLSALFYSIKQQGDKFIDNIAKKANTEDQTKQLILEKSKIENRFTSISKVVKKLYEDYAIRELSELNYQTLLLEYQDEQKNLTKRIDAINAKLYAADNAKDSTQQFKIIAQKYLEFDELSRELINNLIDHIEISHHKVTEGELTREINIFYRFIG